jgi:signal transduction histidine kinase
VIPATAAGTVGVARVDALLDDAEQYRHDAVLSQAQRTVADLVDALNREQLAVTAERAGVGPEESGLVPADIRRDRTDYRTSVAVADVRDVLAVEDDPVARREIEEETGALTEALAEIGVVRPPSVAPVSPVEVVRRYDAASEQAMRVMTAITDAVDDNMLQRQAFGSQALTEANRYSALVDSLVLAAAAEGPQALLPGEVRAAADRQAAAYRTFSDYVDRADDLLLNTDREVLLDEILEQLDRPGAAPAPLPVSAAEWADTVNPTAGALSSLARGFTGRQIVGATRAGDEARERALVEAVLISLLLVGGLVVTVLVGETIARSLRRLARNAGAIAETDLPEALRRIRTDGPDSVTEVATVGVATRDEVGRVARAIDELNQQAVTVARDHERDRRANDDSHRLLANIARRTQSLVERQVALLDRLETDEDDPEQLSHLFRLDHLAARMRRNTDNLMVLAGGDIGGRDPGGEMRLVDTLRAALSETEQYERVDIGVPYDATIAGSVARDVVHLLAELVDNATVFSPPASRVTVHAERRPFDGVRITVTDRGLGMSPEVLAEQNATLAHPAAVSADTPRHMGLFVVSQLAHRHGIEVTLAARPEGGTVATVDVPEAALAEDVTAGRPGRGVTLSAGTGPASGYGARDRYAARVQLAEHSPAVEHTPVIEPPPVEHRPAAERATPSPAAPSLAPSPAPSPAPSLPVAPGASAAPADPLFGPVELRDEETPIYASLSAWFRPDATGERAGTVVNGSDAYATAADAGWSAAAAVAARRHTELTAAGLPRRRAMTALVPGNAAEAGDEADAGAARDPDTVRERLAGYQAGLRAARHARLRSENRGA